VGEFVSPDDASVSLVVPCYNERARLQVTRFADALASYPWLRFCFVDDGSTDATGELLRDFAAHHDGRVSVLALSTNQGKAEAVRTGLRAACQQSPICGFWDADLAAPLHEIAALRESLLARPELEWVLGIRLRSLGRVVERRASRHYLGRAFATVTSMLLGIGAYDTQCGAKLFRSTALLRAVIDAPFRSRWIFDVEMLARATTWLQRDTVRARALAGVVLEQPLQEWAHQRGSKVRASSFVSAAWDLARIYASLARR